MIGAILAGGYGKRLRPHTDKVPKSLLELRLGYTILHKQMDDFHAAGVKRVVLLTSYLSGKIEDTFGGDYKGMKVEYLLEEKPLGKLFSMRNLISVCNEDVILRNGDTVCDIDLGKMERSANESDSLITIFVSKMKSPFGVVDVDSDIVVGFREKPVLDVLINAGIYYFKKDAFSYFLNDYDSTEIETAVFPKLAEKRMLRAYREEGDWIGIDSEKELESARKMFEFREDFEWGYRKRIEKTAKISVWKYRVNSMRSLVPGIAGKLRVISGRIRINGNVLSRGESSDFNADSILTTEDIAVLEIELPSDA